jgi:hypothetical protein
MAERFSAWIRIGGKIEHKKVGVLLRAIRECGVRIAWGEPYFEPKDATELLEAQKGKRLWFCDEEARCGEFPGLEATCRKLGLGYTRRSEAWSGYDAEAVDWRPGMKKPLSRTCSNEDGDIILVDVAKVKRALAAFQAGRTEEAVRKLRSLCPHIPDLPPFEVI